jgi:hypothetical protein
MLMHDHDPSSTTTSMHLPPHLLIFLLQLSDADFYLRLYYLHRDLSKMNPIIPGFAPDPTIIRVEDTFYAVNSSFHIFPCLPVFASKNLVDWEHIGTVIFYSTTRRWSGD